MREIDIKTEVSTESVSELLEEGQKYLDQLKVELADIKVPVRSDNPQVLDAIQKLLGPEYINNKGESYITFEMFLECMTILKNVGRVTAAEYV